MNEHGAAATPPDDRLASTSPPMPERPASRPAANPLAAAVARSGSPRIVRRMLASIWLRAGSVGALLLVAVFIVWKYSQPDDNRNDGSHEAPQGRLERPIAAKADEPGESATGRQLARPTF